MPSPRKVTSKSHSFHGRGGEITTLPSEMILRRPRTVPELKPPTTVPLKMTKVLFHVTIQGSVGPVQVLMNPEFTVKDLILESLKQYKKEGRRPVLGNCIDEFDLHYSQFTLESLDREEKIADLGSRNFFMCKRQVVAAPDGGGGAAMTPSSCSKEAEKAAKLGSSCPWLKFMNFLL